MIERSTGFPELESLLARALGETGLRLSYIDSDGDKYALKSQEGSPHPAFVIMPWEFVWSLILMALCRLGHVSESGRDHLDHSCCVRPIVPSKRADCLGKPTLYVIHFFSPSFYRFKIN